MDVAEKEWAEDMALDRALRARCPSGPATEWPVIEDEEQGVESW